MPQCAAVVADARRCGDGGAGLEEIVDTHAIEPRPSIGSAAVATRNAISGLDVVAKGRESPLDVAHDGIQRFAPLDREQQTRSDAEKCDGRRWVDTLHRRRDTRSALVEANIRQAVELRALNNAAGRSARDPTQSFSRSKNASASKPFGAREPEVIELQYITAPEVRPAGLAPNRAQRVAQAA